MEVFSDTKVIGLEPIQCPTLYCNGYGDHDIQGIGDKHVTWIHNVINMDARMCIDDMESKMGLQLLTDPVGMDYLAGEVGISPGVVEGMSTMFGISGVCNVLGAIKTAKFFGLGENENIVTVLTDGIDRYRSVMTDLNNRLGPFDRARAALCYHTVFQGVRTDYVQEGTKLNRYRWFGLKYYTWVEQQGKTVEELNAQREQSWWQTEQAKVSQIDRMLMRARS